MVANAHIDRPQTKPDEHLRWLVIHTATNAFSLLACVGVILYKPDLIYVMFLPSIVNAWALGFGCHAWLSATRWRKASREVGSYIERYLLDAVNGAVEADRRRRQPQPPEVN